MEQAVRWRGLRPPAASARAAAAPESTIPSYPSWRVPPHFSINKGFHAWDFGSPVLYENSEPHGGLCPIICGSVLRANRGGHGPPSGSVSRERLTRVGRLGRKTFPSMQDPGFDCRQPVRFGIGLLFPGLRGPGATIPTGSLSARPEENSADCPILVTAHPTPQSGTPDNNPGPSTSGPPPS